MKTIHKYISIFVLIGGLLGVQSCSLFVEGYSDDPNNPTDVPESLILPNAILETGSLFGESFAWYSQVFIQTHVGTDRQMNAATQYDLVAADINNPWNSAYANLMMDLQVIIQKSEQAGNNHYLGIAKILMAMSLGALTDGFGDIPYTEAFQGDINPTPSYDDSEETIYPLIQLLLDEAILALEDTPGPTPPESDDLIYSGSVGHWIKAAWVLKARYANHLSNKDPLGSATETLAYLEKGGFTSNADDMQIDYGFADPMEANPWYQFNQQRGDLVLSEFFIDLLKNSGDPRLPYLADLDDQKNYTGSPLVMANSGASRMREANTTNNPRHDGLSYYGNVNSPVLLLTYAEAKFIEAEARYRLGQTEGIYNALREALIASIEKITDQPLDGEGITFINNMLPTNAAELDLELIMTQKYLALFTQFESWTDMRRTGFPKITPYPGKDSIPGRYPYPQRERNLNPENVPPLEGNTMFDKLWWAK